MPDVLSPDLLRRMDACWRASNYLSIGQIYLQDNPMLETPLKLEDVKPRLLGNWGTTPGHCTAGIGVWDWASQGDDDPDVVMACAGDVPTLETLAAVTLPRAYVPDIRIRVVNVVDLLALQPRSEHPHGLESQDFDALFTTDRPVIFAFHGYPALIHALVCELGKKAGLVLDPASPLSVIEYVLHLCDVVLVMTDNPGFSGQKFLPEMLPKIRRLRELCDARGLSPIIEVDGGESPETAGEAIEAGATAIVAGSAIFGSADYAVAIEAIRDARPPSDRMRNP